MAPRKPTTQPLTGKRQDTDEVVAVPLLSVSARCVVRGEVAARVELTQQFRNDLPVAITDGMFRFPMVDNAAVVNFEARFANKTIRGILKPKEQARQEFVEAVAQGFTAALLEQSTKDNTFEVRLGTIDPGARVEVVFFYVTELIARPNGELVLSMPKSIAPQRIAEVEAGAAAPEDWKCTNAECPDANSVVNGAFGRCPTCAFQNPRFVPRAAAINVQIAVDAVVPRAVDKVLCSWLSPRDDQPVTKECRVVAHDEPTAIQAEYRQSEGLVADVELIIKQAPLDEKDGALPSRVLLEYSAEHQSLAACLAFTPVGKAAKKVASKAVTTTSASPAGVSMEFVFLCDNSGSMMGAPYDALKAAMHVILRSLPAGCTFNIIPFESRFYQLFPRSRPLNDRTVWQGHDCVDNYLCGGTDIYSPLKFALAEPVDFSRPRVLVLLTDGCVGNKAQCVEAARTAAGGTRVFTMGIGSYADHSMLQQMADAGKGRYIKVADASDAMTAGVVSFVSDALSGVFTNASADFSSFNALGGAPGDVGRPVPLPNMFGGARYYSYSLKDASAEQVEAIRAGRPFDVNVDATMGAQAVQFTVRCDPKRDLVQGSCILNQIAAYKQITRVGGTDAAAAERLSLRFNVMSDYTAFVAVEDKEARLAENAAKQAEIEQKQADQPGAPIEEPLEYSPLDQWDGTLAALPAFANDSAFDSFSLLFGPAFDRAAGTPGVEVAAAASLPAAEDKKKPGVVSRIGALFSRKPEPPKAPAVPRAPPSPRAPANKSVDLVLWLAGERRTQLLQGLLLLDDEQEALRRVDSAWMPLVRRRVQQSLVELLARTKKWYRQLNVAPTFDAGHIDLLLRSDWASEPNDITSSAKWFQALQDVVNDECIQRCHSHLIDTGYATDRVQAGVAERADWSFELASRLAQGQPLVAADLANTPLKVDRESLPALSLSNLAAMSGKRVLVAPVEHAARDEGAGPEGAAAGPAATLDVARLGGNAPQHSLLAIDLGRLALSARVSEAEAAGDELVADLRAAHTPKSLQSVIAVAVGAKVPARLLQNTVNSGLVTRNLGAGVATTSAQAVASAAAKRAERDSKTTTDGPSKALTVVQTLVAPTVDKSLTTSINEQIFPAPPQMTLLSGFGGGGPHLLRKSAPMRCAVPMAYPSSSSSLSLPSAPAPRSASAVASAAPTFSASAAPPPAPPASSAPVSASAAAPPAPASARAATPPAAPAPKLAQSQSRSKSAAPAASLSPAASKKKKEMAPSRRRQQQQQQQEELCADDDDADDVEDADNAPLRRHKAASLAEPATAKSRARFFDLVFLQRVDGAWSQSDDLISKLLTALPAKSLPAWAQKAPEAAAGADEALSADAVATLLAVFLLVTYFADRKAEWVLILQKAVGFLSTIAGQPLTEADVIAAAEAAFAP